MVKVSNKEKIKDLYKELGELIDLFFDDVNCKNEDTVACYTRPMMIISNVYNIADKMYKSLLWKQMGIKSDDVIKVNDEMRLVYDFGISNDRTIYLISTDYKGNGHTDVISGYFTENGIHVINSKKEIK